MKTIRSVYVALGTIVASAMMASSAMAGAKLTDINGGVLVNTGIGYKRVLTASTLKIGDRVMVNPGSKATLTFADGCSVPVSAGAIVTIGKTSPCAFKAQNNNGENPYLPYIVGGAGAILTGLGIWAMTREDNNGFVSVP